MFDLLEGYYKHYRMSEIDDVYKQFSYAIDFLSMRLKRNEQILFSKLDEDLEEYGFQKHEDGSVYKTLKFNPTSEFLEDSHEMMPLGISFSVQVIGDNAVRKALYYRGMGKIDLSVDIRESVLMEYNTLVVELPKRSDYLDAEYIEKVARLNDLKEDIMYYLDPFLIKSTFVHEMTHWLDNIYDEEIYNEDRSQSWVELKSEINAILHQAMFVYNYAPVKVWKKLSIIDLLVLVRLRRDFLSYVLHEYVTDDKEGWIVNFVGLLKEREVDIENLLDFSPDDYYDIKLFDTRESYRKFYFFIRKKMNNKKKKKIKKTKPNKKK